MAQPGRVASTDNARLSYEPTVLQYVTGSSGIRQWYEAHISASLPLSVQYPAVKGGFEPQVMSRSSEVSPTLQDLCHLYFPFASYSQ